MLTYDYVAYKNNNIYEISSFNVQKNKDVQSGYSHVSLKLIGRFSSQAYLKSPSRLCSAPG